MEQLQLINEALDFHVGPTNWLSCEELAAKLSVPLEAIHAVVEQRWNKRIGATS
jgi:hypothetical protein